MTYEDFQRLQFLRSEIQEDPTKMTLALPDFKMLMNNFHMRLIGYQVKPAPGDDETMRRIIEERSKQKIGDMVTSTREKYSKRLLGMTPAEHYQEVRTAIEAAGFDPDNLEKEINQYWAAGKSMPNELYEKMIVVYQQLRQMGYKHDELTA